MSAKAIERLAEAGAFEPTEGFAELGERHVDFDQLVGGKKREAALGKLLQRAEPVKVAVRGPSGSGKSSMIAATLADLYSDRTPRTARRRARSQPLGARTRNIRVLPNAELAAAVQHAGP